MKKEKPVRVYEKHISAAEMCAIRIYAVPGGYSSDVDVMVKWRGFCCPVTGVFATESAALTAAVNYIQNLAGVKSYTDEQRKTIKKMLPDTGWNEFDFEVWDEA